MNICTSCFQTNMACEICAGTGHIQDLAVPSRTPPKPISSFATDEDPVHASALPDLIKCTLRAAMIHLFGREDSSGPAADTGSLTHVAVAEWHRNPDIAAAIAEMQAAHPRFAQGDIAEATQLFFQYTQDEANQGDIIARDSNGQLLVEFKTSIRLTPAPSDPTQKPIVIQGTIDQVRIRNGRPEVWDLKTSKKEPSDQLNMYLYQLGAYALMASNHLKTPVRLGGLICARQYSRRGGQAHCLYGNRYSDLSTIIQGIRLAVSLVRQGRPFPGPGEHCRYCPLGSVAECVPALQRIVDSNHVIRLP